ncbi:MAG: Fe-S cluster assembly protein SufD [Cyanobacteriota bacterium]|nr:Fe-S cluster assembly protein SufD [Cyanobacteriota bacterium]
MSIQVSSNTIPNPEELGLTAASDRQDTYLAGLLNQCQALDLQVIDPDIAALLQELRDRASLWLDKLTIPTKRDEEWRFTDLSRLLKVNFQKPEVNVDLAESAVAELSLPEAPIRLVFVNGVYTPSLSSLTDLPEGLVVGNLAQLPVTHRSKVSQYLAQPQGVTDVFTSLNTAGLTDAAVVWVAKNTVVETPIHLLFLSVANESATINQPRCLVVAESGSQVSLVEDYLNRKDAKEEVYFTNAVTEIFLEQNAQVSHTRIQREGEAAFHIGKSAIAQARDSRYTCNAISFGARLSRHNLEVLQTGEQTETTLNGLTVIAGEQLADTHSVLAYTKPYGTSNQLHKCIVAGKAHAVFNGKVFVPQAAQLTNAGQLNRNLLLSPKARVDTKPQLEITADNVKCSHGATVGQLEADEIFYLQSRGLNQADARNLLIDAFAAEILNQLPIASLSQQLSQFVREISQGLGTGH